MNKINFTALCLGIAAAGLLWQYYLKPKYDIKQGDVQTMLDIYEADVEALDKAATSIKGILVTRSDQQYETDANVPDGEENYAPDEYTGEFSPTADEKTRFTMIIAKAKYNLIDSPSAYKEFKKKNKGSYPDVDFNKDMIILLESDDLLSNGFFEIDKTESGEDSIIVTYNINLIGGSERGQQMPYSIMPKSKKKIILNQTK
ncbi:MAG: hypothetical protein LBG46_01475 [Elusimicrobiota bacterium]|nr:hypothetical protein [Elusimicrobiota bacterium]